MEELEQITPELEEEQILPENITEDTEPISEVKEEREEVVEVSKVSKEKLSTKNLIFLSEEDKRLLKKYNKILINKLGIRKNKSIIIR